MKKPPDGSDDLKPWRRYRWGRINEGQRFNLTVTDLDDAIGFARLRDYEAAILTRVRALTWGVAARAKRGRDEPWPDARPCQLNLTELGEKSGFPRQRLSEGKASLVAARILIEHSDGSLSINKAIVEWIFPTTGRPRFTPKLLAMFAETWPKTQGQLSFDLSGESEGPHAPACGDRTPERAEGERASVRRVNAPACGDRTLERAEGERASVRSPIEDRPRGIRLSEELEIGGKRADPPQNSLSEEEGRGTAAARAATGEVAAIAGPDARAAVDSEPPLTPGQEQLVAALDPSDRSALGRLTPSHRRRILSFHRDRYQPRLLNPTITQLRGHDVPGMMPDPTPARPDRASPPGSVPMLSAEDEAFWREVDEAQAGNWPAGMASTAEDDEAFWREVDAVAASLAGGSPNPISTGIDPGAPPDPQGEANALRIADMRAGLARGRRA